MVAEVAEVPVHLQKGVVSSLCLANGNTFTQGTGAAGEAQVSPNALSHLAGRQAEPFLSQRRFCLPWRSRAF